jgi:hypothetical protein
VGEFATGKRRDLELVAHGLTPARLTAAFTDIDARLARVATYGVADDGVTPAPVTGAPITDTKPRQAFAVSSTARPNGAA